MTYHLSLSQKKRPSNSKWKEYKLEKIINSEAPSDSRNYHISPETLGSLVRTLIQGELPRVLLGQA
jgi:hypothetical protein